MKTVGFSSRQNIEMIMMMITDDHDDDCDDDYNKFCSAMVGAGWGSAGQPIQLVLISEEKSEL